MGDACIGLYKEKETQYLYKMQYADINNCQKISEG